MAKWAPGIFLLLLCGFAWPAHSQTNDEGLAFLQFNFLNPGARSLAMGGAFIGMADDATGALANPAGLTILTRPEMSFEFSATRYANSIPWISGREIYSTGVNNFYNFQYSYEPKGFPSTVQSLSFASYVYPAHLFSRKFVISGFFNQQTKFNRKFETEDFLSCQRGTDLCNPFNSTNNELDMTMRGFAVSAGFQPWRLLSLGVTIGPTKLKAESLTRRLFDPLDDLSPTITQKLAANDTRFSYTAGVLVHPVKPLSIGFVYAWRPGFHISYSFTEPEFGEQRIESRFKVPNSVGVGISWQPREVFSLNLDLDRVYYSQLMSGYFNAYYSQPLVDESQQDFGFTPYVNTKDFQRSTLEIPDGTEIRVGAEYVVFLGKYPISLRAGYWSEPFHSVVQTVSDVMLVEESGNRNDVSAAPYFSRSLMKNVNHVSFGTGLVRSQYSINWAFDYSKSFKRLVISTEVYF